MAILAAICFGLVSKPAFQNQAPALPYAKELNAFREEDKKNPPPDHPILFIGSSSFTRWTDVNRYFPGYPVLNRAFGGSTLLDQIQDVREVVYPYNPKEVVIYCGENDIAADPKLPAYKVTDRFKTLFGLIRSKFPAVPIVYVNMKPSPSRWSMASKFIAGNRWIEEFLHRQSNATYVDVWPVMLDAQTGRPRADIFVGDKLHMNATGYRLWQPLLQPTLIK